MTATSPPPAPRCEHCARPCWRSSPCDGRRAELEYRAAAAGWNRFDPGMPFVPGDERWLWLCNLIDADVFVGEVMYDAGDEQFIVCNNVRLGRIDAEHVVWMRLDPPEPHPDALEAIGEAKPPKPAVRYRWSEVCHLNELPDNHGETVMIGYDDGRIGPGTNTRRRDDEKFGRRGWWART